MVNYEMLCSSNERIFQKNPISIEGTKTIPLNRKHYVACELTKTNKQKNELCRRLS